MAISPEFKKAALLAVGLTLGTVTVASAEGPNPCASQNSVSECDAYLRASEELRAPRFALPNISLGDEVERGLLAGGVAVVLGGIAFGSVRLSEWAFPIKNKNRYNKIRANVIPPGRSPRR